DLALPVASAGELGRSVVEEARAAAGGEQRCDEELSHRDNPNSTTSAREPAGRSTCDPFSLKTCAPKDPSSPTRTGPTRVVAIAVGPANRSPPDVPDPPETSCQDQP